MPSEADRTRKVNPHEQDIATNEKKPDSESSAIADGNGS
jgi:hypothetical protein